MTRRKDGIWQEVVTINGKRKYFYGKTKAAVLQKIREFNEVRERGALFEDVAYEWWEVHEPEIAYNTTKGYKPALKRAAEAFKDVPIKDITPQDIAAQIAVFSHGRAFKTVRTQLMVYNLIFKHAVENGYVIVNPARDLSVPKNLKKQKRTSPSSEDIKRVKESTHCTFGMFAFWALYTGMRKGELLALEWNDVDVKNRTITINKSLYHDGNAPKVKLPKTQTSVATIPILDALLKKIKPGKGLVFPDEDGGYMTHMRFVRKWQAYCAESGVTATPHQFRHAYATMLFEAGIPPEEAQALLRHAQLSTTMDVYTDLREAKLKKIHERVYSVDIE